MRILQALTWVAPGNPFGGPTRVAMNQRDELNRRGHEITVVAAQPKAGQRGDWSCESLQVRGFDGRRVIPGAGFSGLVAPKLLRFGHVELHNFDVIHIHVARDLVTLPLALQARHQGVPYVLQPHGMVDASDKTLARLVDALATRRVFRSASTVLVLSESERADVIETMPNEQLRLEVLPNGVPVDSEPAPTQSAIPEVLFCSRLHVRKRPVAFAQMATSLIGHGVEATFAMVGADEGESPAVTATAAALVSRGAFRMEAALSPDRVLARLRQSDLLVLPSIDEPFPMVVLEAMSVGLPVVITDTCGLASFVSEHGTGLVVPSDDQPALERAVASLIEEPQLRRSMGERGRNAVRAHLGMAGVADALERIYERAQKT